VGVGGDDDGDDDGGDDDDDGDGGGTRVKACRLELNKARNVN